MVSRKAASRYDAKAGWVTVECATAKGKTGKAKTPLPDPLPASRGEGEEIAIANRRRCRRGFG